MTLKEAIENKSKSKLTWDELNERYGKPYSNGDVLRKCVKNNWIPDIKLNLEVNGVLTLQPKSATLSNLLKSGKVDIVDFAQKYNCTNKEVRLLLKELNEQGVNTIEEEGVLMLNKSVEKTEKKINFDWKGEAEITFGVISDTHLCSKYQQLTHLQEAYDCFRQRGITDVYHAGDICEGDKMRRGHEYELFCHGADAQSEYIIANYPSLPGITTHFITGNHDLSHWKNSGFDIGKRIASERPDMLYIGTESARVMLTPNCSMDIVHPLDGSAYALSYAAQKYCDSLQGGSKPHILVIGHHHKMFYMEYRNIEVFEAGTLQAQSPWMRGKRLAAHVGFWILNVNVGKDGTLKRVVSEWHPFFEMENEDY